MSAPTPLADRFSGAIQWSRIKPERQAEIGALALELAVAWQAQEVVCELDATGTPYARAANQAVDSLTVKLEAAFQRATPASLVKGDDGLPRLPSKLGPACRQCGCSEYDPCPERCGWAEPDLCTACAGDPECQR